MNLKDTYNQIAEDWFRTHRDDTWWVEGVDKFISLLGANSTVLDVGCGAGVKSKYLIDKGLKVTGIDFSEKMIEIAKREVPQATFFVMDINDMGELKEPFDGVFAQAVLLHIPKNEIPQTISKLKDKLKPEGYLYIAVRAVGADGKEEEVATRNSYGYEYSRFFSFFTLPELRGYLKDAGMSITFELVVPAEGHDLLQIVGQK